MNSPGFIEIGHRHICKNGYTVCGDSFICRRTAQQQRTVAVLADGLGSGIKASVLSQLTSTMLARCVANDCEIIQTARTIMETLPVCAVRRIGYATFTIIDIDLQGQASFIEFDNPGLLWIRNGCIQRPVHQAETIETADGRRMELRFSRVALAPGDRLVVFSDGVCQAGMGEGVYPMGWTQAGVETYCQEWLLANRDSSAQELADALTGEALKIDKGIAKDDISAAAIYLRKPRELLVFTGPPFDKRRDHEIAELCAGFPGSRVIAGGTTASIIARELGRTITLDMTRDITEIPLGSRIEGIDLVTEGTITLSHVCKLLASDDPLTKNNPAVDLCRLLKQSDTITFIVGTRVNEAHQDPSLPVDLDIRRNTVRRLTRILEERYFKNTSIRFV